MINRNQYKLLKRMHKQKIDLYLISDAQTLDDIHSLVILKYALYIPVKEEAPHCTYDVDRYVQISSLGIAAKEERREKLFLFYLPLLVNSIFSAIAIGVSIAGLCK